VDTAKSSLAVPESALQELRGVYARLAAELEPLRRNCDARGICCNFTAHGHRLYVTGLEAAEMSRSNEKADVAQAQSGSCPFLRGKLCGIREQRAIGCRIYFCDPTYEAQRNELYEKFLREVRAIEARHGIEHTYRQVTEVEF
jgi:Fe-S-cluster containining protein